MINYGLLLTKKSLNGNKFLGKIRENIIYPFINVYQEVFDIKILIKYLKSVFNQIN